MTALEAIRSLWSTSTRGFTSRAATAFSNETLSPQEQEFLTREFDGARERMTNLASTVGTAGSFVLVLVALLISFANGVREASTKQTAAEQKEALLGCLDKAACRDLRKSQASDNAQSAKTRVHRLQLLNANQAIIGACVMLGFVFGLFGVLTNPVRGPDADGGDKRAIAAWKTAVGRLNLKRNWIVAALLVQAVGVFFILILAIQVVWLLD
jgi:hypothetical protein